MHKVLSFCLKLVNHEVCENNNTHSSVVILLVTTCVLSECAPRQFWYGIRLRKIWVQILARNVRLSLLRPQFPFPSWLDVECELASAWNTYKKGRRNIESPLQVLLKWMVKLSSVKIRLPNYLWISTTTTWKNSQMRRRLCFVSRPCTNIILVHKFHLTFLCTKWTWCPENIFYFIFQRRRVLARLTQFVF